MTLQGARAEELAAAHGTPLYVLERAVVTARAEKLAQLGAKRLYALKANPAREVLELIRPLVDGADVASEGELDAALAAGFSGVQLSLTGPAKRASFCARAVELGAVVNVESLRELTVLRDEAVRQGRVARARLRLNPATVFKAYRLHMTGVPSPFGFDEESLSELWPHLRAAVAGGAVVLEGVHVHPGSQGTSVGGFNAVTSVGLTLLERVRAETGLDVRALNLGGGWGAVSVDQELDVDAAAVKLADQLAAFRARTGVSVEAWVEPGRWLVGPAGMFVTRVVALKRSRGVDFVILDGGVHQHFARAELLLPPKAARADVLNLSRPDAPRVARTLVGPLCTPLDSFGEASLPTPEVGDLLAFQGAGAYGLTFSPSAFLGHVSPREVVL